MKRVAIPGAVLATLLSACSGNPLPAEPEGMVQCPTPRPQVCTLDYRPVCAVLGSGARREYANGCSACGDEVVEGYVEGPCEQSDY